MRGATVERVASESPRFALRLEQRLSEVGAVLADQPRLGRPSVVHGLREYVVLPSYRIVYVVGEDVLMIVALLHTAQRWPPAP